MIKEKRFTAGVNWSQKTTLGSRHALKKSSVEFEPEALAGGCGGNSFLPVEQQAICSQQGDKLRHFDCGFAPETPWAPRDNCPKKREQKSAIKTARVVTQTSLFKKRLPGWFIRKSGGYADPNRDQPTITKRSELCFSASEKTSRNPDRPVATYGGTF